MKYPKPLNVEQSEVVRVIVEYSLNKFCAFVELQSGSVVEFLAAHDWAYINQCPEFLKYINEWFKPVDFSGMAHQKQLEQFRNN